jgi:predicted enzyme related to lactoylglutathione lyase
MRHAFVHFDLDTSDFAGTRRFYEALFGWDFVDVDMGGSAPLAQIRTPSGPSGGLQPTPTAGAGSQWVPYVAVDDVLATLERVSEAGGTVIQGYTAIPGSGAQAIVKDPGGTLLGLWEIVQTEAAPVPAPEPEVVEAEIIEDAEVVEESAAPEVVVDAPAVAEVVQAPTVESPVEKKRRGKRAAKAAAAESTPVAERAAAEPTVDEAPATAKATSKKAAKKPSVDAPAKATSKKAAKKPSVDAPAKATSKKAAKKPSVDAPASKKAAAKKTAKKPVGRGRR